MASFQENATNAGSDYLKEKEKEMSPAGIVGNIAKDPEIQAMMNMAEAAMPGFKDKVNEMIGSLQGASFGDLGNLSVPPASAGAEAGITPDGP